MNYPPLHILATAQRQRLTQYGVRESVDLHCHLLPGVDDGPGTMDEALALCQALVIDGITTVVATPHQLGRYEMANSAAEIRRATSALNAAIKLEGIPLEVLPGADVRIDERIASLIERDVVMLLPDGGAHLLLELPHDTFIDPMPVIDTLRARGITPVITQPERHEYPRRHPECVKAWAANGAMIQLTAASLSGAFGVDAEAACWTWLSAALPVVIATDAHGADRRRPHMSEALELIEERLGRATAVNVCLENPSRILRGVSPLSNPVSNRVGAFG